VRGHAFDPPVAQPVAGTEYELQVSAAELVGEGEGCQATVSLWNGAVRHKDRVRLDSDVARERFVKAVLERVPLHPAVPTAPPPEGGGASPAGPPGGLRAALRAALLELSETIPLAVRAAAAAPEAPGEEAHDPEALLEAAGTIPLAPALPDAAYAVMRARGLVGEERQAKLLYLAATARLLAQPINAVVKGPSGSGKSYLLERVVELLPPEDVVAFTAFSGRYLVYDETDLRHKILVLYEQAALADDPDLAYVVRSLLSEGRLRYGTVEKRSGEGGEAFAARLIEKPGPTALFTSTTSAGVEPELETRTLEVQTTDTAAHSRAVLRGTAARYAGTAPAAPDPATWHAFQRWLRVAGERRAVVPFAGALAELVPINAIRVRRDFAKLLALITASAVLHQRRRPRDAEGRLVATLDDYDLVREVTTDAYAAAQDAGVRPVHRKTLDALRAACEEKGWPAREEAGAGHNELAKRLAIDKGTLTGRMRVLLREGYAVDLNARPDGRPARGRPARYVPGDDPPEQESELPTREAVEARLGEATSPTAPVPDRSGDMGGDPPQHSNTSPSAAPAPDDRSSEEVLKTPLEGVLDAGGALQHSPAEGSSCWSEGEAPTAAPTPVPTPQTPPADLVQGPEMGECWTVGAVPGGTRIPRSSPGPAAIGAALLLLDDARKRGFPAVTVNGQAVGPGEAAWRAAVDELAADGAAAVQRAAREFWDAMWRRREEGGGD
jgi:hypothetical protein